MAHCVNLFICKKEFVVDMDFAYDIGNGFAIVDKVEDIEQNEKVRIAYIETDYFGGIGEQRAENIGYRNGVGFMTFGAFDESKVSNPINQCLYDIGVIKEEGKDEFDSCHLGKMRSQSCFENCVLNQI